MSEEQNSQETQPGMNVPENLLYMQTDEWTKIDGNIATMGITDYAQHQLGDIVQLDLPTVGTQAKKGDPAGAIESVKAVEDFHYPVSGKVTEVNPSLSGNSPDLDSIKSDPYGTWFLKLELSDPMEKDSLLPPEAYKTKIQGINVC